MIRRFENLIKKLRLITNTGKAVVARVTDKIYGKLSDRENVKLETVAFEVRLG